jgi:hypothetical protein
MLFRERPRGLGKEKNQAGKDTHVIAKADGAASRVRAGKHGA